MRSVVAFVALFASACTIEQVEPKKVDAGPPGPCVEAKGPYLVQFREKSGGSCGALANQTLVIEPGKVDPSCTGTNITSDDKCRTDVNVTCGGVKYQTVCIFTKDSKSAQCLYAVTSALCSSQYDVVYTKQ